MGNCLQKSCAYVKCSLVESLAPLKCHMHHQSHIYSNCFLWRFWGVDEKNPITNGEIYKGAEEMFILSRTGNHLLYSGDLSEYLHTPHPSHPVETINLRTDSAMGTSRCHYCWTYGNRDFHSWEAWRSLCAFWFWNASAILYVSL